MKNAQKIKNVVWWFFDLFDLSKQLKRPQQIVASVFQLQISLAYKASRLFMTSCSFPHKLCPLVFANSYFQMLSVNDLTDTFLKTNVLRFWNNTFPELNAIIYYVNLPRVENIPLDLYLFNPSVFRKCLSISVYGYVRSVSEDLFDSLESLIDINFKSIYFRKLIHRNGIGWIRSSNRHININLTNTSDNLEVMKLLDQSKFVRLTFQEGFQEEPIRRIFPDADFCIYTDYPFSQLIFTHQYCEKRNLLKKMNRLNSDYGCTYLWINRYASLILNRSSNDEIETLNIQLLINSKSFKSMNK